MRLARLRAILPFIRLQVSTILRGIRPFTDLLLGTTLLPHLSPSKHISLGHQHRHDHPQQPRHKCHNPILDPQTLLTNIKQPSKPGIKTQKQARARALADVALQAVEVRDDADENEDEARDHADNAEGWLGGSRGVVGDEDEGAGAFVADPAPGDVRAVGFGGLGRTDMMPKAMALRPRTVEAGSGAMVRVFRRDLVFDLRANDEIADRPQTLKI